MVTGESGRANQRQRTRKDLLRAATRLMASGGTPNLDEIAAEALVSRATAYRYFPGLDALLNEATLDANIPDADTLFGAGSAGDVAERLETVDLAFDSMMHAYEGPLRMMLVHALQRRLKGGDEDVPIRQNRRLPLIRAAIDSGDEPIAPEAADLLAKAMALIVGTEGMLVFKDVLRVDSEEARRIKTWAIHALVAAARRQP
jgi:AcrR family transcriptional regulator